MVLNMKNDGRSVKDKKNSNPACRPAPAQKARLYMKSTDCLFSNFEKSTAVFGSSPCQFLPERKLSGDVTSQEVISPLI